jgi:hypothetical protein
MMGWAVAVALSGTSFYHNELKPSITVYQSHVY